MASGSSIAGMFRARRASALGMLFAFCSLLGVSSCLYDSGNRCDAGQVFNAAAGICVCDAAQNRVTGEHGCTVCNADKHEVASNDACVCAPGFIRPNPSSDCTDVPPALGTACQADADCPDAMFDTCELTEDGSGYCTNKDCSEESPCFGGYACDSSATPAFCKRPPIGAGQHCTSDAECAGTEATFCEYFQTQVCYVECKLDGDDCFPGKECCDLTTSSLGLYKKQICVDAGTCKK